MTQHATPQKSDSKKPFAMPDPASIPAPKSTPFTPAHLLQFRGQSPTTPLYIGIKGLVYDVSGKRDMYGPGASYHVLTGRDASRALGRSSLKQEDVEADDGVLTADERKVLDEWEAFFRKRYPIVGKIVQEGQS